MVWMGVVRRSEEQSIYYLEETTRDVEMLKMV